MYPVWKLSFFFDLTPASKTGDDVRSLLRGKARTSSSDDRRRRRVLGDSGSLGELALARERFDFSVRIAARGLLAIFLCLFRRVSANSMLPNACTTASTSLSVLRFNDFLLGGEGIGDDFLCELFAFRWFVVLVYHKQRK